MATNMHASYGEDNPRHKLTSAQVKKIFACRGPHREAARRYGVTRRAVGMIRSGERWGWLTGAQEAPNE